MKLRLMIALAIIALVFGMALTACDDGDMPKIKPGTNETILDTQFIGHTNTDGTFYDATSNTDGYGQWLAYGIDTDFDGEDDTWPNAGKSYSDYLKDNGISLPAGIGR